MVRAFSIGLAGIRFLLRYLVDCVKILRDVGVRLHEGVVPERRFYERFPQQSRAAHDTARQRSKHRI